MLSNCHHCIYALTEACIQSISVFSLVVFLTGQGLGTACLYLDLGGTWVNRTVTQWAAVPWLTGINTQVLMCNGAVWTVCLYDDDDWWYFLYLYSVNKSAWFENTLWYFHPVRCSIMLRWWAAAIRRGWWVPSQPRPAPPPFRDQKRWRFQCGGRQRRGWGFREERANE